VVCIIYLVRLESWSQDPISKVLVVVLEPLSLGLSFSLGVQSLGFNLEVPSSIYLHKVLCVSSVFLFVYLLTTRERLQRSSLGLE